jgi:hypothetical protein
LNVLIPVFLLRAQFPKDFSFPKAFRWLLIATRDGRYSGSALTVLDQDSRLIRSKTSFADAIQALGDQLSASGAFTADDFREEYTARFMRLILYLIVFNRKAHDWINQDVRIGFDKEDNEVNEGFKPEWHHIFPRKVVRGRFDDALVNCLANIAVLNEKANRAFSGKPPREYLKQYDVAADRLEEQAVPNAKSLDVDGFEKFLQQRSENLAKLATDYLRALAT